MQRSKVPYFFLGLAAVLAVAALVLLILRPGFDPEPPPPVQQVIVPPPVRDVTAALEPTVQPDPEPVLEIQPSDLGLELEASNPEELVNLIAKALEAGDLPTLQRLLGGDNLDPATAAQLEALAALPARLRQVGGMREIGELELNVRSRWSIQLDGGEPGKDSIALDLKREDGKWMVERIILPPATGAPTPDAAQADPLGVADSFIQALLVQDFESARRFVDPAVVSDTKIAGMCILFEEGGYEMRKSKPLRTMFQREDTVGFLANVEAVNGRESAQFALTLRKPSRDSNWLVSEINLDQLLAEYSRRMADGDIYYSPLVKNPAGGETLALYFDFDEADINPRTRRQLEIVALILKADPGKRITLSGHTDALGTEDYNHLLSARRAGVVRDFLIETGVEAAQIITTAMGASQPRRPNITEDGEDNPEGRRANRRTEIYLDF